MFKKYRKFIAIPMLSALVLVIGGFCNPLDAQAAAAKVAVHSGDNCGGDIQKKDTLSSNIPVENSVMICCVQRPEKTPVTSALEFSTSLSKLASVQNTSDIDEISIIEKNNLIASLDLSPPKPDKLSSVLRLE